MELQNQHKTTDKCNCTKSVKALKKEIESLKKELNALNNEIKTIRKALKGRGV